MKWVSAGKGIRYREHPSRRYGNHPDRYYALFYKVNGKTYTESLGWESENREPGRSMLKRAEELMAEIRRNRRTGEAPVIKKDRLELEAMKQAEIRRHHVQEELKNISLNEFYENNFKPFIERKLTSNAFRTEHGHYIYWIKDILGDTPIQEINLMAWDKLLAKILQAKLSDRSKNYICGTLCRILKFANERGYEIDIPTMKKLGLKQSENRRLRVITQDELNNIFDSLLTLNIHAYRITYFSFYTGCRFGEAAKLKWSDIQENNIIFRNTKNKTTRIIPMPTPVKSLLSKMDKNNSEYVFTNQDGKIYLEPPKSFKRIISKLHLNDNCDIHNKITFHSLRHTAATYMAKYLDVRSLMDIFGWKNITMAARYMHGNEDQKQKALNSLSEYLEQDKPATIIQFPTAIGS